MRFAEEMDYMARAMRSGTCHGLEMEGFWKGELPSLPISRRSAEIPECPSSLGGTALTCDGAKAHGTEGPILLAEDQWLQL